MERKLVPVNTNMIEKFMRYLYFLFFLSPMWCLAQITPDQVVNAAQYPGQQAEKALNDLLMADYHAALSTYYLNREKAGFMALERFELALQRAIGDIRIAAYIKDIDKRASQVKETFQNWQAAFKRAQIRNIPLEKK